DQRVVLDLAAVTHPDVGADVGAAADHAALAERRALTDLGEVPDGAAVTDARRVRDVSSGSDPVGGFGSHGDDDTATVRTGSGGGPARLHGVEHLVPARGAPARSFTT